MYATTVTNSDGTFSPAIVRTDDNGKQNVWIDQLFRMRNEDKAAKLANVAKTKLEAAVTRLLIEGKYALREVSEGGK